MKRRVVTAAAVLSLVLAAPAFAAEVGPPHVQGGANFEQAKASRLKRLDDRISTLQQEKSCVQAAKTVEDLKNCRPRHTHGVMKDAPQE